MKKGTKTIRRVNTGSKTYYCYDIEVGGKRKRIYADTEQELNEKLVTIKKEFEIRVKSSIPKKDELFHVFATFYFKHELGNRSSSALRKKYDLLKNSVYESDIDIPLESITEEQLTNYYQTLTEFYQMSRIKEINSVIEDIFRLAKEYQVLDEIPNFQKTIPEDLVSSVPAGHLINDEQLREIKRLCEDENINSYGISRKAILIAILTGVMLGDALALTVDDVDMENKTLTFCKKNIVVPMDEELLAVIKELLEQREDDIAFHNEVPEQLFYTNGKPLQQGNANLTLSRIVKRLGLPSSVTCRSLQKYYICKKLEEGTTVDELAEYFHVTPLRITKIREECELRKELYQL